MAAEPDADVKMTEPGVPRSPKAVLRQLRGHASRRFGWGLADQVMSSLTNFAVSIYVVHALGAVQFGAFSLAYVTYGFALNASRGLATDPLMVRFSGTDLPTWRRAVTDCTGTAAVVGLATGACIVVAATVLGGPAQAAFLALGLTMPGLLLQDSWRFSFFALGRGSQAFINDTIWVLTLFPALALLHATHHADVFWIVFAWGATATIGAAVGPWQARVIPRLAGAWRWVSQHRDLGPRYLAEGTAQSAAVQLRAYSVGIALGLAALGSVQAAATLFGPMNILFFGISLVAIPEAARVLRRSPRHLSLFCALLTGGLSAAGLVWGIVLLIAVPRGLGHWLLGPIWRSTYPLVLPQMFFVVGQSMGSGSGTGLHALGASRRSLRLTLFMAVLYVAFSLVGAFSAGTAGAVWGAAVAMWIAAVYGWWQLHAAQKEMGHLPAGHRFWLIRPNWRRRGGPLRAGHSGTELPEVKGSGCITVPLSDSLLGESSAVYEGDSMSEQALDLRKSAQIVGRKKRLVGLLVVLGILVGGTAYIEFDPPMFTSTALVALPQDSVTQAGALAAAQGGADPYTATQQIIATSNIVLLDALPNVRPAMSLDQLRRDIKVGSPTSYVISVSAKGKVAADAETTANAVARSYISYIGSGTSPTRVLAQLFEPATSATGAPLKPLILYALAGAVSGALIGVIIALAIGRNDRRLRDRDQIADSIGVPVLASVSVVHPSNAADWMELLAGYDPGAADAWQLRKALRQLGLGATDPSDPPLDGGSSLAVLSLSADRKALALGPQLAALAADLGIPTALVIDPPQDANAVAPLLAARAAMVPPKGSRHLWVAVSDDEHAGQRPDAALTVVVAVVDGKAPRVAATMRTTSTVLGVSAGAATADELARVANSAAADGRAIAGILVADPDPADRTTGRMPQLARPGQRRTPTRMNGTTTEIRH